MTWRPAASLLAAVGVALFGAWSADALKGATPFLDWFGLDAKSLHWGWRVAAAALTLGCLTASLYGLYRLRSAWLPVRSLGQFPGGVAHKVLVLGLSTPQATRGAPAVHGFLSASGAPVAVLRPEAADSPREPGHWPVLGTAAQDCDPGRLNNINWQQSLRALRFHAERGLQRVVLLPSAPRPGDDNSAAYVARFRQWLDHYAADPANGWSAFRVDEWKAVDYEDFDAIQSAFVDILRYLKCMGYSGRDVVIDITPGQKPLSVAAAMVTLSTGTRFQYVQTAGKFELRTYTVRAEPPPG